MVILSVFISISSCREFRIFCILSGSMGPTIPTGSLILVHTDVELHTEDIVTFHQEDAVITHRIMRMIDDQTYITKGDANDSEDPLPLSRSQIVGKVILHVPFIGYIVSFMKRYLWLLCTAFFAWQITQKKKRRRSL